MTGLVLSVSVAWCGQSLLAGSGRFEGADSLGTDSPSATSSPAGPDEEAARALLDELDDALTAGTAAEVRALASPQDRAAVTELLDLRSNVRRLGITDLSLRYVEEDIARPPSMGTAGADTWVGVVGVRWRLAGYDQEHSEMQVTVTFGETGGTAGTAGTGGTGGTAGTGGGVVFVSARHDHGSPAPLWMLDRVTVARTPTALVMVAGAEVGDYDELTRQARIDVRKVLPEWTAPLVVEVPGSRDQLDRMLGTEEGRYAAIAAVTTPVDGSVTAGSPVHIFVNPPVLGPLGPRGAQIVMSHEAAHVATDAATADMPAWLVEGFADYVALAHVPLPVEVTASQVLDQVRREGAPRALPGAAEFRTDSTAIGASYEASWLACRLLAQTYGEATLLRFYDTAERLHETRQAFRTILGTTQAAFTHRWRDHLETLAG